jgi:multidrug efflux pump subunit AcrA (membrane-fusion protein)
MPLNGFEIADIRPANNNNSHVNEKVEGSALYETQSEAVQEILSRMPHWIVRRGTALLFAVIILLFGGAYFIKFPDLIPAGIQITSSAPPVKIVSPVNGKIRKMFVERNQLVKRNETICLLENTASYEDLQRFKDILNRLDTTLDLAAVLRSFPLSESLQLGELQAGYADFYQSVNQYLFFIQQNFAVEKLKHLQSQISYQAQLNKELQHKDKLLKQQLVLEQKKFMIDSSLVKDKVIAPLEFDNSRKELLSKQINAEATNTGMLQNKLQQTEYVKMITDLRQQKIQQENELQQKIRESVKKLKAQCEEWEQRYLIKSPVEGKAVFFRLWTASQYITAGEALLVIVPPLQDYVASATLPLYGAGKVKRGQKVIIKLSAYPYQEFGTLEGKIETISSIALDTAYSVEIKLINGLTTTRKKIIPAQAQLTGMAEVLTNDKNILERLFENIWAYN